MAITEVFPNAPVKQVIFQIRFPNLFYLADRIGEYQLRVMSQFPHSKEQIQRNVVIAQLGPDDTAEMPKEIDPRAVRTIWRFDTDEGVTLNVQTDSLDISSQQHKTYSNADAEHPFRDVIQFAMDPFLEVMKLPVISRVGLRYIDTCPVQEKTNEFLRRWYNTTFDLDRFPASDAMRLEFRATVARGDYFVRFREALLRDEKTGKDELILDFDGYAEAIQACDYLTTTDELHRVISDEFEASIREPFISYMRQDGGTANE